MVEIELEVNGDKKGELGDLHGKSQYSFLIYVLITKKYHSLDEISSNCAFMISMYVLSCFLYVYYPLVKFKKNNTKRGKKIFT